jgi:hypothetical protein
MDDFNFLDKKLYTDSKHYKFCNANNDILNDINLLKNTKNKCSIQSGKSNIKCNKKINEYIENKTQDIKDIKYYYYDYEINYIDFNINNSSIYDYKDYKKTIYFNNYNRRYNNNI